jgi:hypothetical protein
MEKAVKVRWSRLVLAIAAATATFFGGVASAQSSSPGTDGSKPARPRPSAPLTEPSTELHLGNVQIDSLTGRAQFYTLKMPSRVAVQLELRSQAFDGYLEVFSPDGRPVAADDDSGGDFNPRLVIPPQPEGEGALIVVVSRSMPNDESMGRFQLTAAQIVTQDDFETVVVGATPTTLSGTINPDNVRAGLKTAFTRIPLIVPRGRRLMIDVVSDVFDPAVELQRGASVVARDDDSGDGWNARLIRRLQADPTAAEDGDRYILVVLAPKGTPGPFKATFQLLPEPQPAPRAEPIRRGAPVVGTLTPANPLIDDARPYVVYKLAGRSGEAVVVTALGKESSATGSQPRMSLEAGIDTVAGFAVVNKTVGLSGPAKLRVDFQQSGEVLIRVSANLDWIGPYKIQVDGADSSPATAGSRSP